MPRHSLQRRVLPYRLSVAVSVSLLFVLLTGGQPVLSAPQMQGAAQFSQFQIGDILLSMSNGDILWYDSNGKFIGHLDAKTQGQLGGSAFNPFDNELYVVSLSDQLIRLFDTGGSLLGSFNSGFDNNISILFDSTGNTYVGAYSLSGLILRLDGSGTMTGKFGVSLDGADATRIARFPFPILMDLAVDQRTMFYTNGGQVVHRYDVSGDGVQLADFAFVPASSDSFAPPAGLYGLRLLPPGDGSGGLIVANSGDILRLDSFGGAIQTYDSSAEDQWFTVALDPDGKSFWSTSGTRVFKFDIDSGVPTVNFDAGGNTSFSQTNRIFGLAIVGEFLAAQPTFTPTPTYTETSTSTLTSTPTRTPTGTQVLTNTPKEIPSETPTATEVYIPPPAPPTQNFDFTIITILTLGIIAAGGTYLVARALRSKSQPKDSRAGYRQTRVQMRVQEDPGKQSMELSSNVHLPELQIRSGQGKSDYSIEIDDSGK